MDTTISQILHGCKLARDVEANLPNLVNQHYQVLKDSCEEVVRAFNDAIHELNMIILGGDQELQVMDLFDNSREIGEASFINSPFYVQNDTEMAHTAMAMVAVEGSASGLGRRPGGGSTGKRQGRKRKESRGMRTIRVPAVRTGNIEIPPDDGYTWRKYGQKEILNSRFPRSYFRCTHKIFYGCQAKKQVQRLDQDPYTYEVTYCGDHTCQTSTTPLILSPLTTTTTTTTTNNNNNPQQDLLQLLQPSSSNSNTSIQLGNTNINNLFDMININSHGGESSVAALADVMFNSGSSGSNMDAIFSLKHQGLKDKEE